MIEIKYDDTLNFKNLLSNNNRYYYVDFLGKFYAKLDADNSICLDSDTKNISIFDPHIIKHIVKIKSIDISFEKESCLTYKISYTKDDIYNELKPLELYTSKKSNNIPYYKLINGFFATCVGENSYRLRYKNDNNYYHFSEKSLKNSEVFELNIQPVNVQITLTKCE